MGFAFGMMYMFRPVFLMIVRIEIDRILIGLFCLVRMNCILENIGLVRILRYYSMYGTYVLVPVLDLDLLSDHE